MINIAFNACNSSLGGVISYVELMTSEFPKRNTDCHFTIFLSTDLDYISPLPNTTLIFLDQSRLKYKSRLLWEQVFLPIELYKRKIDLLYTFFATDIYLARCPTVIRIGNMAPYNPKVVKLEKEFIPRIRLKALRTLSKFSMLTSDAALVQSKYAAKELIELSGFPEKKTHGLNRGYEIENLKGSGKHEKIVSGEYILCVSHILRYKLLKEVIDGYNQAKKQRPDTPKLVIPGAWKDKAYLEELQEQVKSLKLEDKVLFTGNVPREQLYDLISASTFCIFSSLVETFPTTLFEKMSLGKALIVSNQGVMPHFCGDSVLSYNPFDPSELAGHIISCVDSDKTINDLEQSAKARFDELDLSWENAFAYRRDLFLKLARPS